MKKLALGLISCSLLVACAGFVPKHSLRTGEPVLQRGWSFVEGEKEFLGQDAGVSQISYSAPVLADEKIVFGSDRFGLTVLAKRNGQVLWQHKMEDGIAAQPYVDENSVVAGTESGQLHKYDLGSGRELWSTALTGPVHGSIIYAFQRLFVGTEDEAVHAIDPNNGKILWTYRRPAFNSTSIRGGGNPAVIAGKIWMGFSDGSLVSLNPQTGGVDSERAYRDNLKFMDVDARVIGWKDGLLVSTYDGKLRHTRQDGTPIWEFGSGGARAPLVTEGETIFFPSSDGNVFALNGRGGEIWRFPLRRGVPTGLGMLTVKGGRRVLVVTSSEDRVFALDAADGKLLGEQGLGRGSGSYAPLAVDEKQGAFYVLSSFSRVHEFRLHL